MENKEINDNKIIIEDVLVNNKETNIVLDFSKVPKKEFKIEKALIKRQNNVYVDNSVNSGIILNENIDVNNREFTITRNKNNYEITEIKNRNRRGLGTNIETWNINSGINSLTDNIIVNLDSSVDMILNPFNYNITTNGEYFFIPEEDLDGYESIKLNVNVDPEDLIEDNKEIILSGPNELIVNPSENYNSMQKVTITPQLQVVNKVYSTNENREETIYPEPGFCGIGQVNVQILKNEEEEKIKMSQIEITLTTSFQETINGYLGNVLPNLGRFTVCVLEKDLIHSDSNKIFNGGDQMLILEKIENTNYFKLLIRKFNDVEVYLNEIYYCDLSYYLNYANSIYGIKIFNSERNKYVFESNGMESKYSDVSEYLLELVPYNLVIVN